MSEEYEFDLEKQVDILIIERDTLRKQLEVAKEALGRYTIIDDFTMSIYAINALAEIEKMGA